MSLSGLRAYVIDRDARCVLAIVRRDHRCADRWGQSHLPTDTHALTLGHIREHPGGKRRDSEDWCIAQCAASNTRHEEATTENRALINAYLAGIRAQMRMQR